MSRGARINNDIRRIIAEEALRDLNLPRKDVVWEIRLRLKQGGYTVPAKDTLEKIISKIRQPVDDGDDYWTFSISASNDIPIEANPILLKLQRWCQIMGKPLNVREAKWIARLKNVITIEKNLLQWAWLYAIRERTATIFEDKYHSEDWDMHLCFPSDTAADSSIRAAAGNVGIFPSLQREDLELLTEKPDVPVWLESPTWPERTMDLPIGRAMERKLLFSTINHENNLSEKGDELYSLWLRYLSEQISWKELPNDEKRLLAELLHKEVVAWEYQIEKNPSGQYDRSLWSWEPSEALLQQVHAHRKRS